MTNFGSIASAAAIVAVLFGASPREAAALSFADEEHYLDFLSRYGGRLPQSSHNGAARPGFRGSMFELVNPHAFSVCPITRARCGGGGGGYSPGGSYTTGSGHVLTDESPEDTEAREGDGKDFSVYEWTKEFAKKQAVKQGVKWGLRALSLWTQTTAGILNILEATSIGDQDMPPPADRDSNQSNKTVTRDSDNGDLGTSPSDSPYDAQDARNDHSAPNDRKEDPPEKQEDNVTNPSETGDPGGSDSGDGDPVMNPMG
ncbi:hypothetical protein [Defluviimonas salinarum]|uniref:Uncharacterized protein n=1 Tax=Defluviimonas salinarum TaxID=2992147 RepID=A0ABT3J9S0_9RHOB|nr:hypothetical protein [Defluviimonas salinarum]MCW3784444.1 hypothetical protein [Defluviimonas salinarum]